MTKMITYKQAYEMRKKAKLSPTDIQETALGRLFRNLATGADEKMTNIGKKLPLDTVSDWFGLPKVNELRDTATKAQGEAAALRDTVGQLVNDARLKNSQISELAAARENLARSLHKWKTAVKVGGGAALASTIPISYYLGTKGTFNKER